MSLGSEVSNQSDAQSDQDLHYLLIEPLAILANNKVQKCIAKFLIWLYLCITKTRLFKYIENFTTKKRENFQTKHSYIFHISAQNIDCVYSLEPPRRNIDCVYSLEPPRRGGSNEYTQSMFLSRNKKNNVYPCKPQFYSIKVGFKGSKLYRHVFVMVCWRIGIFHLRSPRGHFFSYRD